MPTTRSDSDYKPIRILPIAIATLVVAVLAVSAYVAYLLYPHDVEMTVNGEPVVLVHDSTVADALELDFVSPTPGNLLAIDGSLLEEGGGVAYALTLNGSPCYNLETILKSGDVLEVSDGEDKVEPCTVTHETTEPGRTIAGTGAIHLYNRGQLGIVEHTVGDISGIHSEISLQEVGVTTFLRYNANTGDSKVIALTFDDGPWEGTTDQILDILDEFGAKATFFVVGNRVESQAATVLRAHEAGHQICSHSWSHAAGSGEGVSLEKMTPDEQLYEISQGYAAIKSVLGVEPSHVIRAPGGNYNDEEMIWRLESLVNAEIGWNVDTQDWRKPGAEAIADRIKSAESGEIVLMHDGGGDRSQTVEALRIAIPYLQEQGYTFVTIDELLAYGIPQ